MSAVVTPAQANGSDLRSTVSIELTGAADAPATPGPVQVTLRATPVDATAGAVTPVETTLSVLVRPPVRVAGAHRTRAGPARLHVNELVFKFMWEQAESVIRWASWAEKQVAGWPDDIVQPAGPEVGDFLREAAATAG